MVRAAAIISILALASVAQAQETYNLSGQRVAVSGPSGDIRVERGGGSNVVVEVHRRGRDADKVRIERDTEDGYSRLRVVYPKTYSWRGLQADIDLVVRVPDGKDLRIGTASGNIDVGSIATSRFSAHTASGDVTVRAVSGDVVEVSTASGSVRVEQARSPELKAHTASGDVYVELTGTVRSIDASSASGSIEVGVPSTFSGTVDMSTASGDMESDFPMTLLSKRRNSLRAKIGDGSATAVFHTASGDVHLMRR